MAQGLSIVSQSSVSASQGGVSVISKDGSVQTFGTSVVSQNNIHVDIIDILGNPIVATLEITGGSDIDGSYSGFDEYPLTSGTFASINFKAIAKGYVANTIQSNITEDGYTILEIELKKRRIIID